MKKRFQQEDEEFEQLFTIVRVIGSGSFGTVMHVIEKGSGEECAVKAISKSNVTASRLDDLRKEAEILSTLSHPNIIRFRQLKETLTRVYLVMEMIYGGTLAHLISSKHISDLEASKIMTGIFRAVHYLHTKGVIHRDLKPENILIENANDLTSIKIADFGLSQQFQKYELKTSDDYCGTTLYMAPEQIERKYYGKGVDIWSCGVMMFMLCSGGKHPLKVKGDSLDEYFLKLKHPKWNLEEMSPLGRNLFLKLMHMQPVERYSASLALMHPWISRQSTDIPLTPIEQFRIYNDQARLKKVTLIQILWAVLTLGKLVKMTEKSPSQVLTDAGSESPVPPKGLEAKGKLVNNKRSFSVRIRRTSVRPRPVPSQKPKPPIPRPFSRKETRLPTVPRPRVLRPITSNRKINVSFNES